VSHLSTLFSSKQIAAFFLMLALFVQQANAAEESQGRDPGAVGMSCLWRSALCPGWGQLHAGSHIKGAVFLAATAAFAYGHATANGRSSQGQRELNRWTILFWLYNMGDAYVDGYLRGFDAEMSDLDSIGEELIDVPDAAGGVSLGFGLAW
jgi:hypothetical protein